MGRNFINFGAGKILSLVLIVKARYFPRLEFSLN